MLLVFHDDETSVFLLEWSQYLQPLSIHNVMWMDILAYVELSYSTFLTEKGGINADQIHHSWFEDN